MGPKTGVYICECSGNISEKVNVAELLKRFAEKGDNVVLGSHALLCSEAGKAFLDEEIKKHGIERLVVGACSPRQHEQTFRDVMENAGLNPSLVQLANIRELCAWSTEDGQEATVKATALVNAALARVAFHVPLEKKEIDVNPDVLVVGAGVAGMTAALSLAQKGRKVYLVESTPWIGGAVVKYEDVFPNLECAPCMLEPIMDQILHNDQIQLLTNSAVEEVKGFFGNFDIKINKKARYVEPQNCFGCEACYEACPVSVPNAYNYELSQRKAIYTSAAGLLPNVPAIDTANCVRFKGESCAACQESCGFGAVNYDEKDELIECTVGGIVLATGFELFDCSKLPQYGYKDNYNVVSTIELERIISSNGPTGGEVIIGGKKPASAALIHCVGSRNSETCNYCSGICCLSSLKLSHLLRKNVEGISISHFHSDLCLPGKNEWEFYNKIVLEGTQFNRVGSIENLKVEKGKDGLMITDGENTHGPFDMVALSPAVVPCKDSKTLSELFSVDLDAHGFLSEAHNRIGPSATNTKGVFLAGCVQGPKDIQGSVVQSLAAAGGILSALVPGEKLELEVATAMIDGEKCAGCRICNSLCPYKAISYSAEEKVSIINEVLCHGCGTCVAACPAGVITHKQFTKQQLLAEMMGAL
ncbi:MAG: CoB--CoM heterodisulfide reductase iron-sulfur subunit A family protein [bacterium]